MKTKFLSLLGAILFIGSISAQKFTGKITFSMDYELPEAMEAQRSMLPTEMIVYIDKEHTRVEQKTMMGDQNVITNTKTKTSILLMNMMGKKMAITMDTDDNKEDEEKPKIVYSDKTKKIAGFTCKKAIFIMKDAAGEEQEMEVYYTNEIPTEANDKLPGLKGYPLEYTISTQGMQVNIIATNVSKEKVSKNLFEIPEGYEKVSMEDFMKSMGQ